MSNPKVFVTRIIPEKGLRMVSEQCQVDLWTDELPPPKATLIERARGVDGLLCLLTDPVDGEVMEAGGPSLKVISNHAVGYDNIDVSAATARGIPVGNTPGILTETTADFAFALLMAAARRVVEGQRAVLEGKWKTWGPQWLLGADVHGATLGIVGFGRIGQAVARRAAGFGMRILFYDPTPPEGWADTLVRPYGVQVEAVTLEKLLGEADFVTIHTPLNGETQGMFNDHVFEMMKPEAILINTARGPVVDQQALYRALKSGRIAGAAIDVTVPEPLPLGSPLLELENLLVTPHIASASRATREKMATMAAENLLAGVRGEKLPYCVNPEVYDRS
jgi:lactate dehydrogenase-like 2-hydroxyacid dehydrogenase